MADIRSSTWSTTAGNNNASPPDGWPEGQSPSSVNNCAREMMAAIKRAWNDDHPVNQSTGSNSAYILTSSASSTSYATGDAYVFRANHASVGTSTLNVNGNGARVIKKYGNQDTIADDIKANQVIQVAYEPSADVWHLLTAAEAPNLSNLADVDLSGGAATGDTLAYNGTDWTATTPSTALDDLSDVNVSSAATGDALVYDGTDWVVSNPVAFSTTGSSNQAISAETYTIIRFSVTTQVGSAYDDSAFTFTAPVDGVYSFSAAIFYEFVNAASLVQTNLNVNGVLKSRMRIRNEGGGDRTLSAAVSSTEILSQGDVVIVQGYASDSGVQIQRANSFFSGHLVQQTS